MERKAGILMHISSLPNKYGIGTLGKEAYKFVDFLSEAKQTYWQVLPITPTNYGDSPYQSSSVYAFNPYFIDFDLLFEMGLIKKCDYQKASFGNNCTDINYEELFNNKNRILKLTYKNHFKYEKEFKRFVKDNASWLDGYALYESVKESFNYTAWYTWPSEYKFRDTKTINSYIKNNKENIETIKFIQWIFYYQWQNLRKYANKKGVKIIGDMPIYVAYDSADVWFNPELFLLDENLNPIKVAGCPPDYFSADGQLWGNPLYRYDLMALDNYSWWVKRIKKSFLMFDYVRIDHFRGFAGYYTIPYGDKTARNGSWVKGPGYDLFKAINEEIKNPQIIAENLGFLDDEVYRLLDLCGYPGMRIVQFDFGDGKEYNILKKPIDKNNIIYTGTHDNQTILSWYNDLNDEMKLLADEFFEINDSNKAHISIIKKAMSLDPDTCIIPLQDYLGLEDRTGRMNTPSTLGENWRWRSLKVSYNAKLARIIKDITINTKRD